MTRSNHNNVDEFLSLKRIVVLSLAITGIYYLLYFLSHYFGRPSFANTNNTEMVRQEAQESRQGATVQFDEAQRHVGPPAGHPQAERDAPRRPDFLLLILFNVPLTFVMVFAVFLYNRKIMSLPIKRFYDEVAAIVVGSLAIAMALSVLSTLLQLWVFPHPPGPPRSTMQAIRRGCIGDLPLMFFVVMACYLLRSLHKEKVVAVENETLRAENIRTRYEALKNQLDPHFLFNSLNTLQSLVELDPDKAEDFIQQLSSVLRYTLQSKEVTTLAEELDCVKAYCTMMKMRYGDNLRFVHQIDHERYDSYLVLPLSIQGLIENAIKHNVISSKQPLTIQVVTDENGRLVISNKIQPKIDPEEGSGIGLANLAERYRLKWNENVDIFDDGMNFSVTLPLKENEKAL